MKALGAGQREEQPNTKKQSAWSRRHFVRVVGRSVFAIALAAALVVSDALPVPTGLPDTVEAAGPSKGTIRFYEYKAITPTSTGTLLHGDDYYRDTLMIYEINGTWYAPNSKILGDDNWPVGKVEEMIPHFDPDALSFHSRVKSFFKRRDLKSWSVYSYPMFWRTYSPDGSSEPLGTSLPDEGNKIVPGNGYCYPIGVYMTVSDGKFYSYAFRTLYRLDDEPAWGQWIRGKTDVIWGDGSNYTYFRVYDIDTFTYTCINYDYRIGDNQVYVADRDLFLKEGVKLTIPEGSVLCVKNGPFYVNGEIECYGTILVEDGGIIMPYESESGGSRIIMKEGGAMIIRKGGKVYAGCPKDSLWTKGDNGWLDMYEGSSIINFGLFVAGKCNFKYGQATIENHKGGKMYLGYSINNKGESTFMNGNFHESGSSSGDNYLYATVFTTADMFELLYLDKAGATVNYGQDSKQTVIKTWDGAHTCFANKATSAGQTVKLYTYDKDGKCTIKSSYSPD